MLLASTQHVSVELVLESVNERLVILKIGVLCLGLSLGCAPRLSHESSCHQPAAMSVTEAELESIEFESRQPIVVFGLAEPIYGWPIQDATPQLVRNLTWETCRDLAIQTAPLGQAIAQHKRWLARTLPPNSTLIAALDAQERHERNNQAGLALESLVNLANVYSQQPLIAESRKGLLDAEAALEKFSEAGVPIESDPTEIGRQQLKLEQKVAELKYRQQQLTVGLSWLLRLDSGNATPLWTALTTVDPEPLEIDAAIATGLSQRGDLRVLEILATDQDCSIEPESFEALSAGASPALGIGIPKMGPAAWWQCGLKKQIECLKASEVSQRRRQFESLAAEKRRAIELEVRDIVSSLKRHQLIVALKQQEFLSLSESLSAQEKAKDSRPIDFATYQEQSQQLLILASEVIDERFQIEIDRIRLIKAQGGFCL